MGFFDRFKRSEKAVSVAEAVADDGFGSALASNGEYVTEKDAVLVSAVYACVRVIAEDFAKVRPTVVTETVDADNRLVKNANHLHPVAKLLNRKPNEFQTAYEFREFLAAQAALVGVGYAFIVWGGDRPLELLPLFKSQVTKIQTTDFNVHYRISDIEGGILGTYTSKHILELRGMSFDRVQPMRPVALARNTIALSASLEDSQAKLHKNGGSPGGILSTENSLKPGAVEKIKEALAKLSSGAGKYSLAVLDNGLKFQSLRMSGVDAQHLETRRFEIEEVCRWFRVNPIMIMQSDKASTYASAEAFFSSHMQTTMSPWFRRFEDAVDKALLIRDDERLFINERELLRGSYRDQAAYYTAMINGGVLEPNDAREEIGKNPHTDGNGLRPAPNASGVVAGGTSDETSEDA